MFIQGIVYREADPSDVRAMAEIRAAEWGTEDYWYDRIMRYLNHDNYPYTQTALLPRVVYVGLSNDVLTGFIAGHLTHRLNCDGELEWVNVMAGFRRSGVASELLKLLAEWFVKKGALKICIDVEPANTAAQRFYRRYGAENLNHHWLFWKDISVVLKKS
jgi:ribosomal protein S18 acetylase RimI-like enzyme